MAKAWKVKGIAPEKSLEECARRIITTRLREMMSFKKGAMDGRDIDFVHDMRVSSRRLRSAMRNFAGCFTPKKEFRRHLKQVQKITRTMGNVRDLDVLIDHFQKDAQTMSAEEQTGVENLIKRLQQSREEARQPMLKLFKDIEKRDFEKQFLKFFKA